MPTILLFGAALLAVYLGFRFSRQKGLQSPPVDDNQFEGLQQVLPNFEPASSSSPESAERLSTIPTKLPLKRSIPPPSTERDPLPDLKDYQLPTIDLLHSDASETRLGIEANPEKQQEQIVRTLRGFDIEVASITATMGPAMILFELVPAPGVRIARIRHLEEELALALATPGMRMLAPLPGKGTIGIEVPNAQKRVVTMREMLAADSFRESQFDLPIAFGKTSGNMTFVFDLASMPHLLLAGATGQGKSVSLHAMLISLLYKKKPSELKLVLIDLKQIELSVYESIAHHFLAGLNDEAPIVTHPRKAVDVLDALCIEMSNRLELLRSANARNVREYNDKFRHRQLPPERGHYLLPMIVVAIDDVITLIETQGNEAKAPIMRLAENGRSAGIHLILVTSLHPTDSEIHEFFQNIPARAAFRLGSRHDSRSILNVAGAEQLIHPGDMLLAFNNETIRLSCAFVQPTEIEAVTQFIARQPGYPEIYPLPGSTNEQHWEGEGFDLEDRDPLFEEAARLIVSSQLGSTSLIQRKMKLGYNRAGRLMDQLEASGVVGPGEGSQSREVLIKSEMELDQYLNP